MQGGILGRLLLSCQQFVKQHQITFNTLIQVAWAIVLSYYNGQSDVVFGTTMSGRPFDLPGVEEMVGLFINVLPIRVQLDKNKRIIDLLMDLNTRIHEINDYGYLTLDEIQKVSSVSPGTPLFYSVLIFENYTGDDDWGGENFLKGCNLEFQETLYYPLTISIIPKKSLMIVASFDKTIFPYKNIERLLQHLQMALRWIVENSNALATDSMLLSDSETRMLQNEWNNGERSVPIYGAFQECFETQVVCNQNACAAEFQNQRFSYSELNIKTNIVANELIKNIINSETVIGIFMNRSLKFLISMLAVFRVGGVYLPIDPNYPQDRIVKILEQSKMGCVIVDSESKKYFCEVMQKMDAVSSIKLFSIDEMMKGSVVAQNISTQVMPNNLAYIIYTSGSTGIPKGVMIEHRGMLNHLCAKIHDLKINNHDVIMQNASQCFDISVWQFLIGILVGGKVVIIDDSAAHDPVKLIDSIASSSVTILEVVPTMLQMMLEVVKSNDTMKSKLMTLRFIVVTGEELLPVLCREWLSLYPNIPMVNAYGPTECSDDVTHHFIYQAPMDNVSTIPIGKPIQNMQMYVLNKNGQLLPVGVKGELYIGGVGVGRGYLYDVEGTQECFVANKFSNKYTKLYKTGDIVRWTEDGVLEFIGRTNNQVKIHGFRVELGEVEAVLCKHENIEQCVVVAMEYNNNRQLIAYYTRRNANMDNVIPDALVAYMRSKLPEYMIPVMFIGLGKFPLTANGKINRKELPAPNYNDLIRIDEHAAPSTEIQSKLVTIWERILQINNIGIDNSFFTLGGDSLLAMRLKPKIDAEFSIELPLQKIFELPTVHELSIYIELLIKDINNGLFQVEEF